MKERKKVLSDATRRKFEKPGLAGDIAITSVLELEINLMAALKGATPEEHIIASLVILPSAIAARKVGVFIGNKLEAFLINHLFADEEQL